MVKEVLYADRDGKPLPAEIQQILRAEERRLYASNTALKDDPELQTLLEEVGQRVWAVHRVRPLERLAGFLHRSVQNAVYSRAKSVDVGRRVGATVPLTGREFEAGGKVAEIEFWRDIERNFTTLERQVLAGRLVRGDSHEEIALALGLRDGKASSRIWRQLLAKVEKMMSVERG